MVTGTNFAGFPVTLDVRRREFLSVVGPNGCGKTTLLRTIAAKEPRVGIVPSKPTLLGWRSVMGNVMLQAELRGLDLCRSEERARILIASMGLSGLEDRRPRDFMPGMAERVAICRALVHGPDLLVMDDPWAFLDSITREQIAMDLQRLRVREPVAALFATSRIEEAVQLSDRVAVMSCKPIGVTEIIPIDLPHPRRLDKATTPAILDYATRIRIFLAIL